MNEIVFIRNKITYHNKEKYIVDKVVYKRWEYNVHRLSVDELILYIG